MCGANRRLYMPRLNQSSSSVDIPYSLLDEGAWEAELARLWSSAYVAALRGTEYERIFGRPETQADAAVEEWKLRFRRKSGEPSCKSLAEIAAEPPEEPLVRRDGTGNIDIDFLRNGRRFSFYWIREDRVDTEDKLIDFLRHLSRKSQVVVARHFAEMIDVGAKVIAEAKARNGGK